MIVTVTLNPALDITYSVPELKTGTTHRPQVCAQAGGKGVNVARTLHALGRRTVAILPLGGLDGAAVRAELETGGVPHRVVPISGATRRTLADAAALSAATVLTDRAGVFDAEAYRRFRAEITASPENRGPSCP